MLIKHDCDLAHIDLVKSQKQWYLFEIHACDFRAQQLKNDDNFHPFGITRNCTNQQSNRHCHEKTTFQLRIPDT